MFEDLRVVQELIYYENRLVDTRQAVLNNNHSGISGRDAMLGAVDEARVAPNKQSNCCKRKHKWKFQKAGKNVKPNQRQKVFATIRKSKQSIEEIALDFME